MWWLSKHVAAMLALAAPAAAVPDQWDVKARGIYASIVAMPTVKGRDQVPVLAEYLARQFRDAGFPVQDVKIIPFEDTASLVVRYRGNGASRKKPILISAHMDVVDALRSDWPIDPFTLTEKDGFFYGRGSADNKAGIAAIVTVVQRLKAEGFRPSRDLVIAFSGDEETGMRTTSDLVKNHRPLIDAEYALNLDAGGGTDPGSGKPTVFNISIAEKTGATFEVTARNRGGHSSAPRPDNAIYELAAALGRIAAFRFPPEINEATRARFEAEAKRLGPKDEVGSAILRFLRDPKDVAAADALEAQPAYIGWTRTTCVATMLSGGHGENALPQTASAKVNCRIFPGTEPNQVQATLEQVIANPGVAVTLPRPTISAPLSPLRPDVLAAYGRAIKVRHPEAVIVPRMANGRSDATVFRAGGIPTYGVDALWIVLPEGDNAHGTNERVPVRAFYQNIDHWYQLLKELAGR